MAIKPKPDGYHTITPYLIVEGANQLLEFIENVFGGEATFKMQDDTGRLNHADVKIGDANLMLAETCEEWEPTRTMLYVYVENTDAIYQKALDAGAESVKEPKDQFYGDRSASVKDPFGNVWGIATHIEDVSEEEIQKRARAYQQAAG